MPTTKPSSEKKLNVTSPAAAMVNSPVSTSWKLKRVPTPACTPLPSAVIAPVKFPCKSVVTFVNGRLKTPTPDVLCGTVPAGGLKLIVGTICEKAGVAVFGVLNTPEPLLAKNCASTVVVVTVWIGVTHEIVLVFDVSGVPRYVAVPCAVSSPRFAPRYVKVADPLASVGASALVAFTPATARCTARPAIGTPFVSFAVTVSCCDVPVTFGPAFAGASTRVAPAPDEVTLVVNLADTGP